MIASVERETEEGRFEHPTPVEIPELSFKRRRPMEIAFEEKVDGLESRDLAFMIAAINLQMREHFTPKWGIEHWPCNAYKTLKGLPVGTFWPIAILPEIGAPGAAGYHDFAAGLVYGRVRWDGSIKTTEVTASHEALELRGDPYCNKWVDIGGGKKVAFEMSDPCEEDTYDIEVKMFGEFRRMTVSDFLLPSYFKKDGVRPFTYLDTIDENAFSLGLSRNGGGYLLVMEKGVVTDFWGKKSFGRKMKRPEKFRKHSDLLSRFAKRSGSQYFEV